MKMVWILFLLAVLNIFVDKASEVRGIFPNLPSDVVITSMCPTKLETLYVHYIQDLSARNARFVDSMKSYTMQEIDRMFKSMVEQVHSGVSYFTRKKIEGTLDSNTCWSDTVPTWGNDPVGVYKGLHIIGSGSQSGNSQLDALFGVGGKLYWDSTQVVNRLIIMFTTGTPELHTTNLPPFDPLYSCERVDYPPLDTLEDILSEDEIAVIFVVKDRRRKSQYNHIFRNMNRKGVTILSRSKFLMRWRLEREFKRLFCGIPSTVRKHLQLLLIMDNSYDTAPNYDLASMRRALRSLLMNLEESRESFEVALASFIDRPIYNHGQRGVDYCYKEHVNFSRDYSLIAEMLRDGLGNKSGQDFREAQFDALKNGILSDSLGWVSNTNNQALKVVILATDSVPHEKDESSELNRSVYGCASPQYPSRSELRDIINDHDVIPIVFVSEYLKPTWDAIMSELSENGIVVGLSEDSTENGVNIVSILNSLSGDSST